MTLHIPYTLGVVLLTLVGVAVLIIAVCLFQAGHMDTSYRDQIRWAVQDWRERRRRR